MGASRSYWAFSRTGTFTPIRSKISIVTGPLTTRAALLQVLRQAPGYGSDLIRRFDRASARRVRLAPGRVYPVLKELQAEGLVKAVRPAPRGGPGGRGGISYDLPPQGR